MFVMDGMVVYEEGCESALILNNENSFQLRAILMANSQEFVKLEWNIKKEVNMQLLRNTFGSTFLQTILKSAFLSKDKIEKIQLEKISSKLNSVIESNEHHVFVEKAGPSVNMKIKGKFSAAKAAQDMQMSVNLSACLSVNNAYLLVQFTSMFYISKSDWIKLIG